MCGDELSKNTQLAPIPVESEALGCTHGVSVHHSLLLNRVVHICSELGNTLAAVHQLPLMIREFLYIICILV